MQKILLSLVAAVMLFAVQVRADTSLCVACEPGTYSAATDLDCIRCPKGTWSEQPMATSSATCTKCGVGQASNVVGASTNTCQSCPAGSFNNTPGAAECTLCPSGTYNPDVGATACLPCADMVSEDRTACVSACDVNSLPQWTDVNKTKCEVSSCKDGYMLKSQWGHSSACASCPPGKFCPGQDEKNTWNGNKYGTCENGRTGKCSSFISPVSLEACRQAGFGDNYFETVCIAPQTCPAGYYCPAGTGRGANDSGLNPVISGITFPASAGKNGGPQRCAEGIYCPMGTGRALGTECMGSDGRAGLVSADNKLCYSCPVNSVCEGGIIVGCPAGFYQPTPIAGDYCTGTNESLMEGLTFGDDGRLPAGVSGVCPDIDGLQYYNPWKGTAQLGNDSGCATCPQP